MPPTRLSPHRALGLPLVFTLGLIAFGFLDSVRQNPRLLWSFLGAAAALAAWNLALFVSALRTGRTLRLEIVLRKQHYLQACAQGSVLLYWGWFVPEVYKAAPLIAVQLVFAYGVDMLLTWSRREPYTLGLGRLPVVFSINLLLWLIP